MSGWHGLCRLAGLQWRKSRRGSWPTVSEVPAPSVPEPALACGRIQHDTATQRPQSDNSPTDAAEQLRSTGMNYSWVLSKRTRSGFDGRWDEDGFSVQAELGISSNRRAAVSRIHTVRRAPKTSTRSYAAQTDAAPMAASPAAFERSSTLVNGLTLLL